MANPNQRIGKAYITVDGVLYESMTGATLENVLGIIRSAVVGAGVFGFAEEAAAPKITCKFAASAGLSMVQLASVTNSTIGFKCDTGPMYGLNNAWSNTAKLTASKDGGVDVEFEGLSCTELLA